MNKGWRNAVSIISFGSLLIVLLSIFYNNESLETYRQISEGNFKILYTKIDGKGAEINIQIQSDGRYIKSGSQGYTGEKLNTEIGYYEINEIKEFLRYALRHKILDMNVDMRDEDIWDGNTIYFEIILGDKVFKVGGYSPEDVSDDFNKIWRRFIKLENWN